MGLPVILFKKEWLQFSSPLSFLLPTRNIFALEYKQPSCAMRWYKMRTVGHERGCLGPWWLWSFQYSLGMPIYRFLLCEIINAHIFKPLLSFPYSQMNQCLIVSTRMYTYVCKILQSVYGLTPSRNLICMLVLLYLVKLQSVLNIDTCVTSPY